MASQTLNQRRMRKYQIPSNAWPPHLKTLDGNTVYRPTSEGAVSFVCVTTACSASLVIWFYYYSDQCIHPPGCSGAAETGLVNECRWQNSYRQGRGLKKGYSYRRWSQVCSSVIEQVRACVRACACEPYMWTDSVSRAECTWSWDAAHGPSWYLVPEPFSTSLHGEFAAISQHQWLLALSFITAVTIVAGWREPEGPDLIVTNVIFL